jgi:hypothetical protein
VAFHHFSQKDKLLERVTVTISFFFLRYPGSYEAQSISQGEEWLRDGGKIKYGMHERVKVHRCVQTAEWIRKWNRERDQSSVLS